MLLFGVLSPKQGVWKVHQIVLKVFIMISDEMVALLCLHRFERLLFLVVCQRLWGCHSWRLLLIRGKNLSLELYLLIDDLFHHSYKDMNHDKLPIEIIFQLGQQDPLEPKIEALPMHEVFNRLDVGDGVRALNYSSNLLNGCHEHLLDWLPMRVINQSIFQFELWARAVCNDQTVSLDHMVVLWKVTVVRSKHWRHSWNSNGWIRKIIELAISKVIGNFPQNWLLPVGPH